MMSEKQRLLEKQALFARLNDNELTELDKVTQEETFKPGENIVRQGDKADKFYLIVQGQVRILTEDENGESHTVNLLFPGEFFGDIALRYNEPYGATVEVESETKVLSIEKNHFLYLLDNKTGFEKRLDKLGQEIEKRTLKKFSGQNPDEIVLYYERQHWMALFIQQVKNLKIVIPLLAVAFAAYWFSEYLITYFFQALPRWLITFSLAFIAIKIVWQALDWSNDFYIVTNKRVIQIDKVFLLKYERYEAPLNKIENVYIKHITPIEETLFGYGEVEISTASQGGGAKVLKLDYMPKANQIVERIEIQINKFKGSIQSYGMQQKRKALLDKVFEPKPAAPKKKKKPAPEPSWFQKRIQALKKRFIALINYLRPRTRQVDGKKIIWRKHWIALLQTLVEPRALLFTLILVTLLAALTLLPAEYSSYSQIVVIFVFTALLGGIWWLYEDWRNDLYILEEEKLVDIELKPFGFGKKERSTTLDKIQDVRMTQNSPWMVWLGVGHVLVQTAGQDGDFTFDWVKDPQSVLVEIFHAIDNEEEKRQRARSFVINQEILDWLKYYEEERKQRCPGKPRLA